MTVCNRVQKGSVRPYDPLSVEAMRDHARKLAAQPVVEKKHPAQIYYMGVDTYARMHNLPQRTFQKIILEMRAAGEIR